MGNVTGCVAARKIIAGECFKKRRGTYAYMRISPSSLRFLGLDENRIIGIAFNGNTAEVGSGTLVRRVSHTAIADNAAESTEWEKMVGAGGPLWTKPVKVCEAFVEKKTWGPGDHYHVVKAQVDGLGLSAGDRVRLTIEALSTKGKSERGEG